ncbi:hypothetical protein IV498_08660 [Paenarthrobacter sp. Z7-10]|uniref:hypothetical protein n=1 Tax=Paenarthrobacter sp. Z7-10 TaxID=2787635 RepID=UPI0022A939A3|nr:hypothetical protein [Paenarthrobacter sp. Z7-10]MCZ2403251.1 hypothetical protein [Paenarthrobacter sp. Z7-10]
MSVVLDAGGAGRIDPAVMTPAAATATPKPANNEVTMRRRRPVVRVRNEAAGGAWSVLG